MTGPFNTINHETEGLSHLATTSLLTGISNFFAMLAASERRELGMAEEQRSETLNGLETAAAIYDHISNLASDYMLEVPSDGPTAEELRDLFKHLAEFEHPEPLNNKQLPAIAAQETHRFANEVREAVFHGTEKDWHTFKTTIDGANRLLTIGLNCARISALTAH